MQTSGVILDFYDDSQGTVLRTLYPQQEDVPAAVKVAHVLSPEERQALPDDVFALVLMDEGGTHRKYACTDAGNTTLSIEYFCQNSAKLPEEAQKVAAKNLVTACSWYGLAPPEPLLKAASLLGSVTKNPLGALQLAATAPSIAKGVQQEVHARNDVVRGAGGVVTPMQVQEALGRAKHAETSATLLMPTPPADPRPVATKAVISKTAMGIPHLVSGHGGESGAAPATSSPNPQHDKAPPASPQLRLMQPHVDVTDKSPRTTSTEKKASFYALRDKYPLDGLDQIRRADTYFVEHGKQLSPADRHEYCVNLVKRASAVGSPVCAAVRHYGSTELGDFSAIKMAFDSRRSLVQDPALLAVLGELEAYALAAHEGQHGMKTAASSSDPYQLVGALMEFDEQADLAGGYDRDLMDPYFCFFGGTKTASDDYTFLHGNDSVTGEALQRLGVSEEAAIRGLFTAEIAKEFKKDPIGIFKSLPLAQKQILMRMAATASGAVQEG